MLKGSFTEVTEFVPNNVSPTREDIKLHSHRISEKKSESHAILCFDACIYFVCTYISCKALQFRRRRSGAVGRLRCQIPMPWMSDRNDIQTYKEKLLKCVAHRLCWSYCEIYNKHIQGNASLSMNVFPVFFYSFCIGFCEFTGNCFAHCVL